MRWIGHLPPPRLRSFRDFKHRLASRSIGENLVTCASLFIAALFLLPALVMFGFAFLNLLGEAARDISHGVLLFGLSGLMGFKGRRALRKREVWILPMAWRRAETSFVGGRIPIRVTGQRAVQIGRVLIVIAMVTLGVAIDTLLDLLR